MHYRVHTCSVNRDFPVLVKKNCVSITGFSLCQYQLFSVLVTFFPCLVNIFPLFNLQGFPSFNKYSDLLGLQSSFLIGLRTHLTPVNERKIGTVSYMLDHRGSHLNCIIFMVVLQQWFLYNQSVLNFDNIQKGE